MNIYPPQQISNVFFPTQLNVSETNPINAASILRFLQQAMGTKKAGWLNAIIDFAQQLPALSGNILEIHFGKAINQIDFATRLNADFDGAMIEKIKRNNEPLPFADSRLATLIQPNGIFINGIKNIWIEYDAPFQNAPALFFDIERETDFSAQQAYKKLQCVAEYFQFGLNDALPDFLKRVEYLNLHIIYYGFMYSRNSRSVRMTINGIEPENLSATLNQLGWKGNYATLEKLISTYKKKRGKNWL